jgi:hypothetical protein
MGKLNPEINVIAVKKMAAEKRLNSAIVIRLVNMASKTVL